MKRPGRTQVSTNVGLMAILSPFLTIFSIVPLDEGFKVLSNLTFGQLIGMVVPILGGLWGIISNERQK